jgi:hypothetical protein
LIREQSLVVESIELPGERFPSSIVGIDIGNGKNARTVTGFSAISFPNATQKCEVRQVEEQGKKLLVRIDLFWKIQGQASLIFLHRPWLEAWGSNLDWPRHTGSEVPPSGLNPNSYDQT